MNNKKLRIFLIVVAALIVGIPLLAVLAPHQAADGPWTWAQTLKTGPELKGYVWGAETSYQETPLKDEELAALVALLNKLDKSAFTENKALAGITPEYGIRLVAGTAEYTINQADAPKGALEMNYSGKQWWIDNKELSDYVRTLSGWRRETTAG